MFGRACLIAAFAAGAISVASATPVPSVVFADGNVLNIEGVVGSGPNNAYLVVDYSNNDPVGPSFAWEYQWANGATPSETDMINAVTAATSLVATDDPTFLPATAIENFAYEGNTDGTSLPDFAGATYWGDYLLQYSSADDSVQNEYSPSGPDDTPLGYYNYTEDEDFNVTWEGPQENGLFYGWAVNGNSLDAPEVVPNLPEIAGPEPASAALAAAGVLVLLRRPKGPKCA
jgi:hypothetical protein